MHKFGKRIWHLPPLICKSHSTHFLSLMRILMPSYGKIARYCRQSLEDVSSSNDESRNFNPS